MKLKKGYRKDKPRPFIGKWLKRYFEKRSCRKSKIYFSEERCPVCGYYCLGRGGVDCIDKPQPCKGLYG